MNILSRWLVGVAALGVASCGASPPKPQPATAAAPAPAESIEDGSPIPARVAAVHRKLLDPVAGAKLRCIITVHDEQLEHGEIYAVALFTDGAVATWTQTSKGAVEPFLARLTAEEDARALGWIDELASARGPAHARPPAAGTVVGVSTRSDDGVDTSYFASREKPDPLEKLMLLLKHRLESTNAR